MDIYDKGEKIIYCYNCQSRTIYNCKDIHGNSGVESHCTECGWFLWMNNAVELERKRWREHLNPILLSSHNGLSVR